MRYLSATTLGATLASASTIQGTVAVQADPAFRAPAIPLLTTDPFTQTWIRGDTSTSTGVSHWDGTPKTTNILLRIGSANGDVEAYQLLGVCTPQEPDAPGPEQDLGLAHDVSPGSHDIANFENLSSDDCNRKCYGTAGCLAYVMYTHGSGSTCYLKSAASPVVPTIGTKHAYLIDPSQQQCTHNVTSASQQTVHIEPTRTVFELTAGNANVNLTFLSTMFTDDYERLSRPAYYVDVAVSGAHSATVYAGFSAEYAVNVDTQQVNWGSSSSPNDIFIGNADQKVLGSKGDGVNIDWGYLHLLGNGDGAELFAGSLADAVDAFLVNGSIPATADTRAPRAVSDDLPGLSTVVPVPENGHATIVLGYDDVKSVRYFGDDYPGFWTQSYSNITDAMVQAANEFDAMLEKSVQHDAELVDVLTEVGGSEYAQLCALSYRQTLAATKLVWNTNRSVMWNFLKEISTNGDMSTMDVIYPASPMLL